MASTAAMVFFWRPGRMSRRALLTGFLVCAVAADAASSSKAGIKKAFFILSSGFGKSRISRAGGCAPPELQPVPLRKGLSSGIIMVCLYLAGLFRAKDTEVCVNDPTGALWGAQTTVLPSGRD